MGRFFNVNGDCKPGQHYMVDIHPKLDEIKEMVDRGDYFTINRARQYGKTTTLRALGRFLEKEYLVISLDFQMLSHADFKDEPSFISAFSGELLDCVPDIPREIREKLAIFMEETERNRTLSALFKVLSGWCGQLEKPVILLIDEVDSASNDQVFLDFLAQLRNYYLEREAKGTTTFQSVILAGVYDIKNLKRKIRPEDDHKTNSPWNIAADFDINMSLSRKGIEGMLREYEADHAVGMDPEEMAGLLYRYTSGYPFLVSRLCKLMDEKTDPETAWTKEGFLEAVRMLLLETNPLFESLIGKLTDYPELEQMLGELLFFGKTITYNPMNPAISLAMMFGFVKNADGKVIPANRIFDTLLYNHFLSLDELHASDMYRASLQDRDMFVKDGHLDMRWVLTKFVQHFQELYGECRETFLEEEGRRYFLLYLRPIINGTGNYYVEARTRSLGRTDIVVDYRGEQFVIETKIWRGNEYNLRGEHQLMNYLEDYGLDTGYMLSFNFNQKKQVGVHELKVDGKTLIEAVV